MLTAREELNAQHEFDDVVVNDDVDTAVAAIASILMNSTNNETNE